MWSDNDIDNAFQRLDPPEPDSTPFPLDAWLHLEAQLDKTVMEQTVRRKLWRLFAAEAAVVALVALAWLLWPSKLAAPNTVGMAATPPSSAAKLEAPSGGLATSLPNSLPRLAPAASVAGTAPVAAARAVSSSTQPATAHPTREAVARMATPAATPASPRTTPLLAAVTPAPTRENDRHRILTERAASSRSLATEAVTVSPNQRFQATSKNSGSLPRKTATDKNTFVARLAANGRGHRARLGVEASHLNEATPVAGAALAVQSVASTPAASTASELALTYLPAQPVALASVEAPALPTPLAGVPVTAAVPPDAALPVRQPRFYVGLAGAPDVSTVRFADVESPLLNTGITLEYRLTNRLRVSTGVLRSNKQYEARREDYDFGPFMSRVMPRMFEYVDGTCTVLDIPLNLRYDVLVTPRHRLFGSAGLSSYFMQREQYAYDYVENNMESYWKSPLLVNENRHLFSILNLSAGYEHSLGSHWSLQAEPYVKVPLTGVGLGKVRLTSAGVFFGVKYGF